MSGGPALDYQHYDPDPANPDPRVQRRRMMSGQHRSDAASNRGYNPEDRYLDEGGLGDLKSGRRTIPVTTDELHRREIQRQADRAAAEARSQVQLQARHETWRKGADVIELNFLRRKGEFASLGRGPEDSLKAERLYEDLLKRLNKDNKVNGARDEPLGWEKAAHRALDFIETSAKVAFFPIRMAWKATYPARWVLFHVFKGR